MTTEKTKTDLVKTGASNAEVEALRAGIDRTRTGLSETIHALEERLNPADLREKAASELVIIEDHVKAAVRGELNEAKAILKEELSDAKQAMSDVILKAKDAAKEDVLALKESVKQDVIAAKDAVTNDVKEAIQHAKESARAATLGRLEDVATQAGDVMNTTKDTLMDTVRQNPIPAALAGIGLAWLLMNRSTSASKRSTSGRRHPESQGHDQDRWSDMSAEGGQHGVGGMMRAATDAAGSAFSAAGNAIGDATHATGETLGKAAHATGDMLGKAAHGAGELAHDAGVAAGHAMQRAGSTVAGLARQVPRQAMRAEGAMENVYRDNPLAIGAAVVAAGVLAGMVLPRTRREDAFMGEARDHLLVDAKNAAHDALEKVQHLGEDAAKNVKGVLTENAGV